MVSLVVQATSQVANASTPNCDDPRGVWRIAAVTGVASGTDRLRQEPHVPNRL
jgi:hypothetical protein